MWLLFSEYAHGTLNAWSLLADSLCTKADVYWQLLSEARYRGEEEIDEFQILSAKSVKHEMDLQLKSYDSVTLISAVSA